MADTPLPRPTNRFVELINIILDHLIKGLGTELTITAATAYAPWLGYPVIRYMFRQLIVFMNDHLDTFAKKYIDVMVIRFQNDNRKGDYDREVAVIKNPGATSEDIQRAKDAMDRLIRRSK